MYVISVLTQEGQRARVLPFLTLYPGSFAPDPPHSGHGISPEQTNFHLGGASVYIFATPGVFEPPQSMMVCMGAPMCFRCAAPNLRNACHRIVSPPLKEADQGLTQRFAQPVPGPPLAVETLEGPEFDQ